MAKRAFWKGRNRAAVNILHCCVSSILCYVLTICCHNIALRIKNLYVYFLQHSDDVFGIPVCKFGATLDENGKCSCPKINCKTVAKSGNLCASNGVTYNSYCDIFHDICKQQIYLFVFKKGACGRFQ